MYSSQENYQPNINIDKYLNQAFNFSPEEFNLSSDQIWYYDKFYIKINYSYIQEIIQSNTEQSVQIQTLLYLLDKDCNQNQVKQYLNKINSFNLKLNEVISKIKNDKNQNFGGNSNQLKFQNDDNQLLQLLQQILKLKRNQENLELQLKQKDQLIEGLKNSNKNLEIKINHQQNQLILYEKQVEQFQQQFEDQKSKSIETCKNATNDIQKNLLNLQLNYETCLNKQKKDYLEFENKIQEFKQQCQEDSDKFFKENKNLNQEIIAIKENLQNCNAKNMQLENSQNEKSNQIQNIQVLLQNCKDQNQNVQEKIFICKQQFANEQDKNKILFDESTSCQEKLEFFQKELLENQQNQRERFNELEILLTKIDDNNKDLELLRLDLQKSQNELKNCQQNYLVCDENQKQNNQQEKISKLEIQKLKILLDQKNQEHLDTNQKLFEFQQEQQKCQDQFFDTQNKLMQLKFKYQNCQDQNQQQNDNIKNKEDQLKICQNQVSQFFKQNENNSDQTQRILDQLKEQIKLQEQFFNNSQQQNILKDSKLQEKEKQLFECENNNRDLQRFSFEYQKKILECNNNYQQLLNKQQENQQIAQNSNKENLNCQLDKQKIDNQQKENDFLRQLYNEEKIENQKCQQNFSQNSQESLSKLDKIINQEKYINQLEQKLLQIQQQLEKQTKATGNQNSNLTQQMVTLNLKERDCKNYIQDLENQIADFKVQVESLQTSNDQYLEYNFNLQEKGNFDFLQIKELTTQINDLKSELEFVKSQLNPLELDLELIKKSNTELNSQNEILKQQILNQTPVINDLNQQNLVLKEDREKNNNILKQFSIIFQQLKIKNQDLLQENQNMLTSNQNLLNQIEQIDLNLQKNQCEKAFQLRNIFAKQLAYLNNELSQLSQLSTNLRSENQERYDQTQQGEVSKQSFSLSSQNKNKQPNQDPLDQQLRFLINRTKNDGNLLSNKKNSKNKIE